jgi:hypothetical protein
VDRRLGPSTPSDHRPRVWRWDLLVALPILAMVTVGSPAARGASTPASGAHSHIALRDEQPPQATVTISAVGDTMLGTTPELPPDPSSFFDAVKAALTDGTQIVFGNLEGTLTNDTTSKCSRSSRNCWAFRVPTSFATALRSGGFTVLNDANNHFDDFGARGESATVSALHTAGIAQTGLPGEITVVPAGRIRVGFVAFAPYAYTSNLLDFPSARSLIQRARAESDVVVVYMHTGAEGVGAGRVTNTTEYYLGENRGNPEAFAHMAIDAGADLVVASGPHVLRGMQLYRGHLIAYSLGNFAGFHNFALGGPLSISCILRVTLTQAGQLTSARVLPVHLIGPGQPVPGGDAVADISHLSSTDFGSTGVRMTPSGSIDLPRDSETVS